jgi:hypothetical protein
MHRWENTFLSIVVGFSSLLLLSCGGGGGGGGGGGAPPAAQTTTVSGSVQAPGGQVAFNQPQGLLQQFAQFISPSAYASVSGISPVPDGTTVQLIRLNATGTSFTVLASTMTSGGRYMFNLTSLGLQPSSDLAVRVANGVVQMRAFVTGMEADIGPTSETAAQLVLEQIFGTPGATINQFTTQELADITGSIDTLSTLKQLTAGLNIQTTITSIRNAVAAEPGLMAFITAAAAVGQTAVGPGDIGNYVPLTQGNFWRYQGTKSDTGQQTLNYENTVTVNGTKVIGTVTTTVLTESNPDGAVDAQEEYLFKDSLGLNEYGNNDTTDTLTPRLVPFPLLHFPLAPGSSFTQLNKSGVDYGQDRDGDGRNESVAINSQVSVIGMENVTVPVGSFTNVMKVQTVITITLTYSSDGSKATATETDTQWLASGVGPVRNTTVTQGQGITETITEELASYVADGQGGGIRIQVTPTSLATQPNLTKPLQATAFDQSNAPISGVVFAWKSTDPGIAQVAQDGTVTGIAPGTASVTASADGLTSNAVKVTVNDIRILLLTTNDIIYDKLRQKIYASIPSTATSNPNSITVIDPVTLNVGPSVPVGSEPTKLAISDDGQVLYAGLDGEGAVQQVSLSSFTAGPKFSLGTPPVPGCGVLKALDLKVLPGTSQSVAVAGSATVCSPLGSLAIYDNGVQRPNTISPSGQVRAFITSITFSQSPSTLYGYDSVYGLGFLTMVINSSGVSIANTAPSLISGSGVDIEFDAGRVYASSGVVIDPGSMTGVGTFQDPLLTFQSLIKPDSSIGRVFFVSGNVGTTYTVLVFDINSLNSIRSIPVESITGGPPIGPPGVASLIRWGTDGIAFRSSLQIAFVHTSSIQ